MGKCCGRRFSELLTGTRETNRVNQNAHFLRTREQKFLCFLERSDSRFTRNGRKPGQELLERFSAFQVVEQRLDRHSCSAKDGSSTENIPIFGYDFHHAIVPRTEVSRGIARLVHLFRDIRSYDSEYKPVQF